MSTIQLGFIDYLIITLYLLGIITIGLKNSRFQRKNSETYLLAGRRLSLPAFVATLVSTWYGGILGIGEFTYRYGILNWIAQGLPYYFFAVIFAIFFAPKIQKTRLYTIPDQLYDNYGLATGFIGSIFIFLLTSPAPFFLMTSLLISAITGLSFWYAFLISVIFSISYVVLGGFQSIVKTDIIQFLLMFIGFIVLIVILINSYGGVGFLTSNLPGTHLSLTGGKNVQYVLVWFFIALWTFVDPGFYQRCYAAKTPQTARNGILASVVFWFIFDILTTLSGLYSRILFPDINPLMAFPKLGESVLPTALRGLFFVGLLATIMSTLDSTSFLSAITFGRDLVWRIRKKGNINKYTQIGIVVSIVFSAVVIHFIPSVVNIWYILGTLFIPALIFPLISIFLPLSIGKMRKNGALICIVSSFVATFTWFGIGVYKGGIANPIFPFNIQPFFIGLSIASVIFVIDILGKSISRTCVSHKKDK